MNEVQNTINYPFKTILAENLIPGQLVVNLGVITSVERQDAAKLMRVVIMEGYCLSCAFYWFRFGTMIKVI